MYRVIKTINRCLLATGVLCVAAFSATAQTQPSFELNQEAIDLKAGVLLATLQQQDEVFLSLAEDADAHPYDSLILYLARGNRPLVRQATDLKAHTEMEISQVLKGAHEGDRLVLELISKNRKDPYVTTVIFY